MFWCSLFFLVFARVTNKECEYWQMDRTSILGDTIDYMKELLERINKLQEGVEDGTNQINLLGISKDLKPTEVLVRNSPKVYNLYFCTLRRHLIRHVY